MPIPDADQQRLALAERLQQSRLEILTDWTDAVRDDPLIPDAHELTLAALQDHFPQLLNELLTGLRQPATLLDAESRQVADNHGSARWRQGYRLDEVLRELARIREILLGRVRNFCAERQWPALRDDAEEKVRRFFDLAVARSARQFMQEQEEQIVLRAQQLENAYQLVRTATQQLRASAHSRWLLLHGASHELRNALQAVELGATALLQEDEVSVRTEIFSRLSQNSGYLQRVLDRLHQFSNILAGETQLQTAWIDLDVFLKEVEQTHRPAAERKGLRFVCPAASSPATVRTDVEKLRHIADILLSNAIEYTDIGSVEMAATAGGFGAGHWIFRVVDTGAGIHEMDAKMTFQAVHRSERSTHRGVGLGLLLARHIARLLHGDITFETRYGEGSRFEVTLPSDIEANAA